MDYRHPERAFFKNPKLLGLSRQIGPKNVGAFSAKVQYPSWHCESLVHGFEYLVGFLYKTKWDFRPNTYKSQINPKYDIALP